MPTVVKANPKARINERRKAKPEPRTYLWTRDEYDQMVSIGLFDEKRVELIEGRVIEMSPMGSLHAVVAVATSDTLRRAFGQGYHVRVQMPFNASHISEPEPDVAVVVGKAFDYQTRHPEKAALLVEVSDSTLIYDRKNKASLYAKTGIREYWIINLVDYQVEIYRRPVADSSQVYGFAYADVTILTAREDVLTPLAMPQAKIKVGELVP